MKDTQLYLVIGIMVGVDLVVMTAWQIFDPFYRETKELVPYVSFLIDAKNIYHKIQCVC